MAKLIVVFGATGIQGGSVARYCLKDTRSFKVRAVTRHPNSPKAQELEELGAEVVRADLDDPSTLPDVLSGCHGVFAVTNIWEHINSKDQEVQQGKALVDACSEAGVKHLIFSLGSSVKEAIGQECILLDGKAEIEKYMLDSGVPCTSVHYPMYMENLLAGPLAAKKQHDGTFSLVLPLDDKPAPFISVTKAGQAIASLFRCPDRYYGKVIALAGDNISVPDMADILSKHLSPKVFRQTQIPLDRYANMGFPGAEHLAVMFDFIKQGKQEANIHLTNHLDPFTIKFERWVFNNKAALNTALDEQD